MRRHASIVLWLCVLAGCSTTVLSPTPCTMNAECRRGFGVGHVCSEGYCTSMSLPPRCTSTFPDDLLNGGYENPVVYGVLSDRSVPSEVRAERAVRLVALLANRQGGLQQRTIGLVMCDVQSDETRVYGDSLSRSEAVLETARFLTRDLGTTAVIGPGASSDAERVFAEVVRPAPALLFTAGATSNALTMLDRFPASDFTPGYLWRTVPPDTVVLDAMAADLVRRNVTSLFVTAPEGVGQASSNYLQEALGRLGANTAVEVGFYPPESRPDMIDALNNAAESRAQEVVFLGDHSGDAVSFLTLVAGDERFDGRRVFMNDTAAVPELLTTDAQSRFGRASNGFGLRIARYVSEDSIAFRNFRNQYRAEYANEDPALYPLAARSHDAMWLLLFGSVGGLSRAGNLDAQAIALGLRALSGDGASRVSLDQASWRAAQISLMGGGEIDVVGASGDLDFDSRSEEMAGTAEIVVVDGRSGAWSFTLEPEPQ